MQNTATNPNWRSGALAPRPQRTTHNSGLSRDLGTSASSGSISADRPGRRPLRTGDRPSVHTACHLDACNCRYTRGCGLSYRASFGRSQGGMWRDFGQALDRHRSLSPAATRRGRSSRARWAEPSKRVGLWSGGRPHGVLRVRVLWLCRRSSRVGSTKFGCSLDCMRLQAAAPSSRPSSSWGCRPTKGLQRS